MLLAIPMGRLHSMPVGRVEVVLKPPGSLVKSFTKVVSSCHKNPRLAGAHVGNRQKLTLRLALLLCLSKGAVLAVRQK